MKFGDRLNDILKKRNLIANDIYKGTFKKITVNKIRGFLHNTILPNQYEVDLLSKFFGLDMGLFLEEKKSNLKPLERFPKYKKVKDNIPLLKVEGGCTFIGCNKPAVHNCHYTGLDQSIFGKSLGKKGSNLFVADLCLEHHQYFDQPVERKSERLASEFKTCILLTIKRKVDDGRIIFKK